MSIKLCVFDMAGTTLDEDNVVYKTLWQVLQNHNYDVSLQAVLESAAGKEKRKAIFDLLNDLTPSESPDDEADELHEEFQRRLKTAYAALEIVEIDGVKDAISKIRQGGIKVVLNTGYDRMTAELLLEKLYLRIGHEIDGLVTAEDVEQARPHPAMIHRAMQMFDITDPKQVLKAGDSVIDVEEGKNAEVGMTIAVLSGAQKRAQLETAEPDHILNDLTELPAILQDQQ